MAENSIKSSLLTSDYQKGIEIQGLMNIFLSRKANHLLELPGMPASTLTKDLNSQEEMTSKLLAIS